MIKTCKQCGIDFKSKRRQVYCSNLCYKKSYLRVYKLRGYEWKEKWDEYHMTRNRDIFDTLITYMYNEEYTSNKAK